MAKEKTKKVDGRNLGSSEVRNCGRCIHTFQDATYGQNRRVHNKTQKGWRCTVCGSDNA
jgi:hypothetical protein